MKWSRKELEGRAGAFAARRIQRWLSRKSTLQAERFGERLGRVVFFFFRSRRKRTLSNLEMAFPEKSPQERHAIAKGVFMHFGRIACDFARTDARSKEEVLENMELEGCDDVYKMLPRDEGVIVLTGHFGNWERIANYLALRGYPFSVVVRDADDGGLNQMVIDMRRAAGLEIISRGNAARQILTGLKKKLPIAILPDQNSDEAFLPFFGKPCGTVLGPGVLAQRAKASIYIVFCYRTGPGKYRLRVSDHIRGDNISEYTPEEIMTWFNATLEATVRDFPDQYLWMHDRWKMARRKGLV